MRESEERLCYLVENSLAGIFVIQDNQIVLANPEQERLSGPLPIIFIPMDLEYVHPDDVDKVRHSYEAIRSGQVQTMDTDFRFYPFRYYYLLKFSSSQNSDIIEVSINTSFRTCSFLARHSFFHQVRLGSFRLLLELCNFIILVKMIFKN